MGIKLGGKGESEQGKKGRWIYIEKAKSTNAWALASNQPNHKPNVYWLNA